MRRELLAACFLGICAMQAAAQDVTLSSRDGAISVSGTLQGFDGETYRVSSEYGLLSLDASGVTCEGVGCPKLTDYVADLHWAGPATLINRLVPLWLEGFAQAEGYKLTRQTVPNDTVQYMLEDVETGGTIARFTLVESSGTAALEQLAQGGVDTALSRFTSGRGQPGGHHVVALDALVAAVGMGASITSIDDGDLGAIIAGDITNWEEIDGAQMPITLHLPPAESEIGRAVAEYFSNVVAPDFEEATPANLDPFSLSVLPLSELNGLRALTLNESCGLSASPTAQVIRAGEYPYLLPVYLHLPEQRPARIAREFLSYIRSDAAQSLPAQLGFIDQRLDQTAFDQQGGRLANAITYGAPEAGLETLRSMVADLQNTSRVSLVFRFEDGTARLDPQSSSNIARIVDAIEQGRFDEQTLILAGFSDGQGGAEGNLNLSRQRAEAVRDIILGRLRDGSSDWADHLVARGYGEVAPIACDEEEWGRRLNRRVEIWVTQR